MIYRGPRPPGPNDLGANGNYVRNSTRIRSSQVGTRGAAMVRLSMILGSDAMVEVETLHRVRTLDIFVGMWRRWTRHTHHVVDNPAKAVDNLCSPT
jgi:hypothetical protein